ncbi:MAG: GtrA family protein [Pseudomonadota bacterium]
MTNEAFALVRDRIARSRWGRVSSFAIAGGSGFIIDVVVLYLLLTFTGLGPFTARIVSIACAMITNFLINRTFTFGASGRSIVDEGTRYSSVGMVGAGLNYVLYAGILIAVPGFSPFIATMLAVVSVAAFSYAAYSRFVFKKLDA